MDHHEVLKEKVFALYDGELAGDARQEAEAHLKSCSECRAMVERWMTTATVFFKESRPMASEFFVQCVMDRIKLLERPRRMVWPALEWRWLVPAFGVAAGVLFLILQLRQQPLSIETLLLGDTQGPTASVLSNKTPTADELLGFVMEG